MKPKYFYFGLGCWITDYAYITFPYKIKIYRNAF